MSQPTRRVQPLDMRAIMIQGDSVRAAWGVGDEPEPAERKPLRRHLPPASPPIALTDDALDLRIGEELDYARRMLKVLGDDLAGNPAIVMRHGRALQSIDIVGQTLNHLANVIRSSDPKSAIDRIGMVELKARLKRSGAL